MDEFKPHIHPSEHSGKGLRISQSVPGIGGRECIVHDYWDRMYGITWQEGREDGLAACIFYDARARAEGLPLDNEVLYVRVGSLGYLVHVTEIVG